MASGAEQLMFEHPWNRNAQNAHKFDILAYVYADENHETMPLAEPCILDFINIPGTCFSFLHFL